jgi:hypothetical protein
MTAHMKLPRISAGLLLVVALAIASARAQTQSAARVIVGGESVAVLGPDQAKQVYAHAKPYMDDPPQELKRAVPALGGLKADPSQVNLQSILDRAGDIVQTQVPKLPDLTARESIWQAQFTVPPKDQGEAPSGSIYMGGRGRGAGRMAGQMQNFPATYTNERDLQDKLHSSLLAGPAWKDFDYNMLSRQLPGGSPMLEESRSELNARNGERLGESLHGTGFAHLWLLFLPGKMVESTYRLLGQQKMHGHETYVVAFAESPERVTLTGQIASRGMTYPLLYQGIAWIDESTFRIVRLRTDLLAPLPDIEVQWLSSDLQFSEVRMPELDLPLWLPHQVELTWRQGDELVGEMHIYTKYRLFHATARILPPS